MKRCGLLVIFCAIFIYGCQSAIITINKDLPIEIKEDSAHDLVRYTLKVVQNNIQWKEYIVGEVFMFLDKDLKGDVSIFFVENPFLEKPRVAIVEIDTKKRKLISISKISNESKANPGQTSLLKWNVTNLDAYEITKEFYKDEEDFYYEKVIIRTDNFSEGEFWKVSLYNPQKKLAYRCKIDPYSGEIVSHDIY